MPALRAKREQADPRESALSNPNETKEANRHRQPAMLFGAAALVALVGLADAIYLTVEHLTGQSVRCNVIAGCSEVLSSPYATVRGYPLALLGSIAYFTVFSLATLAAFGYRLAGRLLLLVAALMFLTTLWLLYLQAFIIHHFCQFCLLSALVTITLTALVAIASRIATRSANGD